MGGQQFQRHGAAVGQARQPGPPDVQNLQEFPGVLGHEGRRIGAFQGGVGPALAPAVEGEHPEDPGEARQDARPHGGVGQEPVDEHQPGRPRRALDPVVQLHPPGQGPRTLPGPAQPSPRSSAGVKLAARSKRLPFQWSTAQLAFLNSRQLAR